MTKKETETTVLTENGMVYVDGVALGKGRMENGVPVLEVRDRNRQRRWERGRDVVVIDLSELMRLIRMMERGY